MTNLWPTRLLSTGQAEGREWGGTGKKTQSEASFVPKPSTIAPSSGQKQIWYIQKPLRRLNDWQTNWYSHWQWLSSVKRQYIFLCLRASREFSICRSCFGSAHLPFPHCLVWQATKSTLYVKNLRYSFVRGQVSRQTASPAGIHIWGLSKTHWITCNQTSSRATVSLGPQIRRSVVWSQPTCQSTIEPPNRPQCFKSESLKLLRRWWTKQVLCQQCMMLFVYLDL